MNKIKKLEVVKKDDSFVVQDDEGVIYGSRETRKKAEELLKDWNAYYAEGE